MKRFLILDGQMSFVFLRGEMLLLSVADGTRLGVAARLVLCTLPLQHILCHYVSPFRYAILTFMHFSSLDTGPHLCLTLTARSNS